MLLHYITPPLKIGIISLDYLQFHKHLTMLHNMFYDTIFTIFRLYIYTSIRWVRSLVVAWTGAPAAWIRMFPLQQVLLGPLPQWLMHRSRGGLRVYIVLPSFAPTWRFRALPQEPPRLPMWPVWRNTASWLPLVALVVAWTAALPGMLPALCSRSGFPKTLKSPLTRWVVPATLVVHFSKIKS